MEMNLINDMNPQNKAEYENLVQQNNILETENQNLKNEIESLENNL